MLLSWESARETREAMSSEFSAPGKKSNDLESEALQDIRVVRAALAYMEDMPHGEEAAEGEARKT